MRNLILLGLLIVGQIVIAQPNRIAVLSFERVDKESEYVATQLMRRDMSVIFQDYKQYELIDQKEVDGILKKQGVSTIFNLTKEQIASIAASLNAGMVMWGNVETKSATEFTINAKIWSKMSNDVKQKRITVSKSSKDRVITFKKELVDKLEELFGAEIEKMISIAMQHYNSANWTSAEDSFLRVLEINPDLEEAYFYLGYINFRKDNPNYEKAEFYYLEGLKRNPNNREILNYLSANYLQQRKFDDAIDILTRLAEVDNDKLIWFKIAKIYMTMYEYDNAINAFDKAIEADNNYAEAYNEAGLLLYDELQAFEQAIPYLEQAVRLAPDDENLQSKLARCYFQTNRLDNAIEQYKTVIRDQPQRLSSYYNLARAYRMTGQKQLALQTLMSIKDKDAKNPRLHYSLSDAYLTMDNYDEAMKSANQAIALNPDIYEPYMILAQIFQTTGYKKYEDYLRIEEAAKKAYGKEADTLVQQRDKVKAEANSDFAKSEANLNNAKQRTNSSSVLKDIDRRMETLKKLLDATKKGFF
jgi:tetratricopeptide (TPR) repeat protein